MCFKYGVSLPRSDHLRFSFLPSTRPEPLPNIIALPSSISFRVGPVRTIKLVKCTLNYTLSLSSEQPSSFYDLLGISGTCSLIEIKQAYKQMARKYHPDVSPPGQAEEYTQRFIRVQEAYETLSDPRRRALYDLDMAEGLHLAFSARRHSKFDEVCSLFHTCKNPY
ncbi:Chaperone protein dnaJ 20 [Abeliophyllum distichum]|uniref:Chaperone protein dnaJ 20 n=1 Tax=Abeliophyllum distichum TaxID=126358 RepID=A0ABD1NV98_9LAMI